MAVGRTVEGVAADGTPTSTPEMLE
jgi:hypothetical protein